MPKPKKGRRLGANPSHQRLLMSGLATQLFEHGRITTTEAKARFLRPIAEKLITKAKKAELGTVQSLHYRREVLKVVRDKSVVHALFTEIGPSFAERPGGYTRITKLGPRKGDNAPMAVIELVTEAYKAKDTTAKKSAPAKTGPATSGPAETSPAAEPVEAEESAAAEADDAEEPVEETPEAETAEAVEAEAVEAEEPAVDDEPEAADEAESEDDAKA